MVYSCEALGSAKNFSIASFIFGLSSNGPISELSNIVEIFAKISTWVNP